MTRGPGLGGLPEWAQDEIFTRTEIRFGTWDRMKLLLFGRAVVEVAVATEHLPGRTESVRCSYIPRVKWPWRRERGYEIKELEKP